MPLLGLAAWTGGLLGQLAPTRLLVLTVCTVGVLLLGSRLRHGALSRTAVAAVALGAAVLGATLLRGEAVSSGPVADLAREHAVVELTGRVTADPRLSQGQFGPRAIVRLSVQEVVGRGLRHRGRAPVLVIGDPAWLDVPLGATVRTTGRLASADDDALTAIVVGARDPTIEQQPDFWWSGAAAVRASLRDSVAHRPADQRGLVPALVDGDDAGLDEQLVEDFRTTGLTHLTAVSGTNLTLVVGFLLLGARWVGVRGRWLLLVGGLGVVGFVLLARTEPSVVRAAAMGSVGLLALSRGGRDRAFRALGVAVVVLLFLDPGLAISVGFALSVLATAGIVALSPPMRDALMRWVPRWVAEAIAVPTAAQLACTPVVAGISGQVSLVAVVANLAVAPAVGPATVLGLLAGLVGLVADAPARVLGTLAGWCVAWIVWVAEHGARLPAAALDWGTGPLALVVLTLLTVLIALTAPRLLRRPVLAVLAGVAGLLLIAVRLPALGGGAPDDWWLAMCDVGQGDALAVRTGAHAAIVVDAGPDPTAVDACLDDLGVTTVPLVVLTHFHADHVDGLEGVLEGRQVSEVWVTHTLDPPDAVDRVTQLTGEVGVRPVAPEVGLSREIGQVSLQVLAPDEVGFDPGAGDGTSANDASLVLLAEVAGVRVLFTGDIEPHAQQLLASSLTGLAVDVLKVPHHGSRYQDEEWLTGLAPKVALVSVGEGNDYGHPARSTLDPLVADGARVLRTDQDGLVVLTGDPTSLTVETSD